ncbi:2-phospho-L-lactate transferase [Ramlibacter sp.]|uniref:2-phospho-L-lactate transferase n=1 Tax=Ramlibacter sp. TaxID=1917967 RepID=UPI002FCC87E3
MIHAFSGGVGGAKLARGLADEVAGDELAIVVNTGDDFDYLGLRIMPDFDSVAYAIAGRNDEVRGWGRAGETWQCKESLVELGVDAWFSLGDKDLAMHLLRLSLLKSGATVGDAAQEILRRMGIRCRVLPMTDDAVETIVVTPEGELGFQDYFVRRHCQPRVSAFRFAGLDKARPSATWFDALASGIPPGVIICPSNPYVSIDPILALRGVREALQRTRAPVVAVSPLVGGDAVKGPLAKMLRELGRPLTPVAIAEHYGDLLDGFVLDARDEAFAPALLERGLRVAICDTLMPDRGSSRRVARACLALLAECGAASAA